MARYMYLSRAAYSGLSGFLSWSLVSWVVLVCLAYVFVMFYI